MYCIKCGNKAAGNFCSKCGTPTNIFGEIPPGSLILKNYKIISKISETQFSRVYQGIHLQSSKYEAIKELKLEPCSTTLQTIEDINQLKREISFINKVNSQYVVKYVDSGAENGKYYLLTEFITGLDLKKYKSINGPCNEPIAIKFGKDIFLGTKDFHSAGILSRDIKPQNLIYNGQIIIHIDFGIGKKIGQNTSKSIKHSYTPFFAPPEQRMGNGTFEASDIYSACATLVWLTATCTDDTTQLANILQPNSGQALMPETILKVCQNISAKFACFLAKGVHPNHLKRWQTAEEAYKELSFL